MTSTRVLYVALLVWLTIWLCRFGSWYSREGRWIKPGNSQTLILRVGNELSVTNKSVRLPYKAWSIRCELRIKGCQNWSDLKAGDGIKLEGKWQSPEGKPDQVTTLVVNRIGEIKKLNRLTPWSIWWWIRQIDNFRSQVLAVYRTTLSEPYSGLIGGIVLGFKSNLDQEFYEALIATGTIHVIAASGYNITVVVAALLSIALIWCHRKQALWFALIGVGVYVLLAGASPPILRAGIMGVFMILSQLEGRLYLAKWGLMFSLGIMLIIWPWMINSASFILSAAATVGIIWGSTLLQDKIKQTEKFYCKRDRFSRLIGAELSTTLAAILVTVPLILVFFERVSLISPLVNLLVVWLVPPLMALGAVLAVVGLVWPAAAYLVAWITYPILWLFVTLVETGAKLPFSSVNIRGVNWVMAIGWWLVLAAWWRWLTIKNKRRE